MPGKLIANLCDDGSRQCCVSTSFQRLIHADLGPCFLPYASKSFTTSILPRSLQGSIANLNSVRRKRRRESAHELLAAICPNAFGHTGPRCPDHAKHLCDLGSRGNAQSWPEQRTHLVGGPFADDVQHVPRVADNVVYCEHIDAESNVEAVVAATISRNTRMFGML